MEDIMRCPFCGSNNLTVGDDRSLFYRRCVVYVKCQDCGGMMADDNKKVNLRDIMERWNRRAAVTTAHSEWINVKDRLPEDENHVLALTETAKGRKNIVRAYYCQSLHTWAAGMNNNVTHWMPLPEPPKEET